MAVLANNLVFHNPFPSLSRVPFLPARHDPQPNFKNLLIQDWQTILMIYCLHIFHVASGLLEAVPYISTQDILAYLLAKAAMLAPEGGHASGRPPGG